MQSASPTSKCDRAVHVRGARRLSGTAGDCHRVCSGNRTCCHDTRPGFALSAEQNNTQHVGYTRCELMCLKRPWVLYAWAQWPRVAYCPTFRSALTRLALFNSFLRTTTIPFCALRVATTCLILLSTPPSNNLKMFPRRVTRSVTRAAAATPNHPPATHLTPVPVPAPAPAPPAAAAPITTVDNPAPVRTRSGRLVRQIATTVQKLTGGRRGKKAAEQDVVESQASTSKAPARSSTTAPPPRKRSRKDAPAASTSANDAPTQAPATTTAATRKRAPKKQAAAKPRGRSNQAAVKASIPTLEPVPEAERALVDTPTAQPKAVEEYDALISALDEFNRTTLANHRIKRAPLPPYKPLFDNLPRFKGIGPTVNFFDPAFRLVCGDQPFLSGVQEQPAVVGADAGYETESDDGSAAGEGEGVSSQSSGQPGLDVDDLNHHPIVLPTLERREEVQVLTEHPIPGATLISRQNAYIFDRNGRPLPTGREPGSPEPIGDNVATLLKSWRGPPYPAHWHGPMFEEGLQPAAPGNAQPGLLNRQHAVNLGYPEDVFEPAEEVQQPTSPAGRRPRALLTRQNAVNLGYPDRVPKPSSSSLAQTAADPAAKTVPTHQYGYKPAQEEPVAGLVFRDMYAAGVDNAPAKDDIQVVEPVGAFSSGPAPIDAEAAARRRRAEQLIKEHGTQPLRRQSHIILENQRRLQQQGLLSPHHAEELDVFAPAADSPGPSTAPRPHPRPGCELKRHHAVYIDKEGREIPIHAADDASDDGELVPIGILVADALEKLRLKQAARAARQSQPQTPPLPRRSASPFVAAAAPKVAALERTSSQNGLSLLSSPRKGKAIPFSRQGSQAPLDSEASFHAQQDPLPSISEPARVDKGKGRALPEPEPEHQNAPVDKGKKRVREEDDDEGSSQSSTGDLDEVEASLVIDSEEGEDEDEDGEELLFAWPRNYVLRKSLFRVEVSMIPMPYLPVAPLPKDGEPALKYIGPQGTQPPTILTSGSKRARDEDDAAEDIAPSAKKVRVASK
ncbi:hypothetical protein K466DRAFT_657684 [Polyporus arcularius HHB13444]|uniref:Uncharacterized protein n=1 Tax=Polyporus arcularius HHB13444 TaxID=1314778 RepID=A0A5C3Q0B3_9APHY|nr:hypothetical protein K466DRAFT_657684 [Polyporus arcularius HHB13444]